MGGGGQNAPESLIKGKDKLMNAPESLQNKLNSIKAAPRKMKDGMSDFSKRLMKSGVYSDEVIDGKKKGNLGLSLGGKSSNSSSSSSKKDGKKTSSSKKGGLGLRDLSDKELQDKKDLQDRAEYVKNNPEKYDVNKGLDVNQGKRAEEIETKKTKDTTSKPKNNGGYGVFTKF